MLSPSAVLRLVTAVLTAAAVTACATRTAPWPFGRPKADAVTEYIRSIAIPTEPDDSPIQPQETGKQPRDSVSSVADGSAHFICETKSYRFGKNFTEIAGFNPNEPVIWPGSLVQGRTIETGIPSAIDARQAPLVLTITDVGVNNSMRVGNPTFQSASQALNTLRARFPVITPANVGFEFTEMYTAEQALLRLDFSARWIGGNARAQLAQASGGTQRSVLVKFVQRYYTVAAEPEETGRWFHNTVGVDELRPFAGPGNAPAVVTSVNYGRMFLFVMTSSESYSDLMAKARLAQSWVGGGMTAEAEKQLRQQLSTVQISWLIIGGGAPDAVEALATNNFMELIRQGANVDAASPPRPISYTVNYLKNGDVAKVAFTTNYDVTECMEKSMKVKVTFQNFRVIEDCDGLTDGKGDFVWWFRVDDEDVVTNTQERNLGGGEQIDFGESKDVTVKMRNGAQLKVSGEITDKDGASGDDIMGPFAHLYSWSGGAWQQPLGFKDFELKHDNSCKAKVRYTIQQVQ